MGTLGKAAGVGGAFVAGSATAIEYLLQKGRSYIFTTAAPAIACALSTSLHIIRNGDALRANLMARIAQLREGLAGAAAPSATAIQPYIVGDNEAAVALSKALWERGLWVPAIRPPTVPKGTARLRISSRPRTPPAISTTCITALKELA
jgi:8-amino-7-oxononanoate synthase